MKMYQHQIWIFFIYSSWTFLTLWNINFTFYSLVLFFRFHSFNDETQCSRKINKSVTQTRITNSNSILSHFLFIFCVWNWFFKRETFSKRWKLAIFSIIIINNEDLKLGIVHVQLQQSSIQIGQRPEKRKEKQMWANKSIQKMTNWYWIAYLNPIRQKVHFSIVFFWLFYFFFVFTCDKC